MYSPKSPLRSRLAVIASVGIFSLAGQAFAVDPPGIMGHQGRLAISGTNYDGTGYFKFAFVNVAGTTSYWANSEDTTPADGEPDLAVPVAVDAGHYAVALGDTAFHANMETAIPATVFTDHADVRLRIWFSSDNATFHLLTPDRRLPTGGYAFSAARAESVADGVIEAEDFASDIAAWDLLGGNANWAGGKVGIGVAAPTSALDVAGTVQATAFVGDGSGLTGVGQWDVNGSNVYRVGGNVGIGTTVPSDRLHVLSSTGNRLTVETSGASYAGLRSKNSLAEYFAGINPGANSWGVYDNTAAAQRLSIAASGNVGIGVTNPATPFALVGNGGFNPVGITQNAYAGGSAMELTTLDGGGNQASRLVLKGASDVPDIELLTGAQGAESATVKVRGATGNVGIGPAAAGSAAGPNSRLHVDGDGVSPSLRVQVNGFSKLIVDENGGTAIGSNTTPPEEGLYVKGDVGIGTTTPYGRFQIVGDFKENTNVIDQENLRNGTATAAGKDMWQSFTARSPSGNSTILRHIHFYQAGYPVGAGDNTPATVRLYEGEGIAGPLLSSVNYVFNQSHGFYHTVTFFNQPRLEPNQKYTIHFSVPTSQGAWWGFGSNYADGTSGNGSTVRSYDLAFRTFVEEITPNSSLMNLRYGNLGVGVSNPVTRLHVKGGARFSTGISGPANQHVYWNPGDASWSFTSDRNTKEEIVPVDPEEILEKLTTVPIAEWQYIGYEQRHIGPMAQDFHAAFPLSERDTSLNDADLHGVALAGIQGLNLKVEAEMERLRQEKDAQIVALREKNASMERQLADLVERDRAREARLEEIERLILHPDQP